MTLGDIFQALGPVVLSQGGILKYNGGNQIYTWLPGTVGIHLRWEGNKITVMRSGNGLPSWYFTDPQEAVDQFKYLVLNAPAQIILESL